MRQLHGDWSKPFGKRLGDLTRVPRGPDARAADATPATINEHAVCHKLQVLLPVIYLVVAKKDFAEARPMSLHARIALVTLDGGCAAKNQAARAVCQHGGTDVPQAGVNGDRLARDASGTERLGHA